MRFKNNFSKNVQFQKGRKYSNFKFSKSCFKSSINGLFFFSKKNIFIEMFFFIFLKKIIKFFLKKNNSLNNIFFLWFSLKLNYPISKKSKNSRMGKGKGQFLRWILKFTANSLLLKIKCNNFKRINYIIYNFKRINFKNFYITKIM